MSIYIFSRPIHSGKSTELRKWCDQQKNISGILMPDINGRRKILDIQTKEFYDIEYKGSTNSTEPLTSVGRFHFYTAVFDKANTILINALTQNPDWLVIDEAGKLELEGKGFYYSIAKAVALYNSGRNSGNLLITVRESLCDEVILFFTIKDHIIIHKLEELI